MGIRTRHDVHVTPDQRLAGRGSGRKFLYLEFQAEFLVDSKLMGHRKQHEHGIRLNANNDFRLFGAFPEIESSAVPLPDPAHANTGIKSIAKSTRPTGHTFPL